MKTPTSLKISLLLLACTAGWLCAPTSASAQTLYLSNLGENMDNGVLFASDRWIAEAFVTGTTSAYELNTISISSSGAFNSPAGFSIHLFSDNAGTPGSSLGSLSGLAPTPAATYAYSASGLTLSASTKYWVVLATTSDLSTGGYFWNLTHSSNYTSQDGWTLSVGQSLFSSDGGSARTGSGFNYQLSVTATAVPEPSTWALALCGLLVTLLALRHSSRARRCASIPHSQAHTR